MICEHCNKSVEIRNPIFDFDRFIIIGKMIGDLIYEIPKDDLEWFNKSKKDILEALAMTYIIKELKKDLEIIEDE